MSRSLGDRLAAQAFYLDTRGGVVLCWWHAPQQTPVSHPVLMCPTWGDEEIGAYGGWQALAQRLAHQGVPVLRLDLPGEGDSLERTAGQACWSAWLDALEQVVTSLRQVTASRHVHLLGLRLGALLAAQLADRLRRGGFGVASLLLLAPVASGRAFLRETRMLGAASQQEALAEGEVVAGGFVLDAHSAEAIGAAAWPSLPLPEGAAACPVLLLERSDRPLPARAHATLQAWSGGGQIEHAVRDDLAAVTNIAHSADWPDLTPLLLAWLRRPDLQVDLSDKVLVGLLWPSACAEAVTPRWTESVVTYGPGLVAQCTRPLTTPRRATVFLSSGAERRIGPHRLWVGYARERAAQGEICLRLDLAGLGDSAARPDGAALSRADVVYDPRCVEDVRAALQWLEQTQGVTDVRLVGLCSGAYHAWRCAVAGLRLSQVVAINPLVFHWRSGMSLDPTDHAFGQIDIADGAVRSLRDPARWLKLLRGQVHLKVILRAVWARFSGRAHAFARQLGRQLHWPLSEDVVSDVRQVIRCGTPLSFVFAEGDPGQALLRQLGGAAFNALIAGSSVHLTTIAHADHTFSTRSSRDSLYNCLNSILSLVSVSPNSEDRNLASPTPLQS